ncbi:MAG: hypothetical protein WKF94_10890 [Solirubrobacteraceae bacterium]
MDQISPPMRIVLAVAVVFLAAYMLVLRPSEEEVASAPVPVTAPAAEAGGEQAATDLGKAVEGARETAGAAESAAQARAGETAANAPSTNQSSAEAARPAPAKPTAKPADPALADLPQWLRTSIDKKVVALLFTNGESADDRRTARALKRSYDGDGAVVTRIVNVKKVSSYQAVAEGVDVSQSPTLMVIDRNRSAQALPGFASLTTINQAIIDGLLATDNPVKEVDFLKLAQREGKQISTRAYVGVTEGTTPAGAEKNVNSTIDLMNASLGTLRNAPVPKAYKDVKAQLTRYIASEIAVGKQILGAISDKTVDVIAVDKAARSNDKLARKALLALNGVGVDSFN